ncbi:di-trans,poly-cis-decaprenylcistransferase [Candidatus Uhrbacteria bacterium]|nr:di-trans,poly-cis-decaprenylcistransferase [Candidatus Uhrbacteria bacterium]
MKHLAIILDGNRRWAKERKLPSLEGHRKGYENVKTIGLAALDRGVEHFSVFAFSTENWKRSQEEVGYLMELLFLALTKELDFFLEHDVRLKVVGRREGLSDKIQCAIDEAETKTALGTRGQINLCINYGGRAEIVDGIKKLIAQGKTVEEIDEELVSGALWTNGIPEPDMIVRTSGEQRLSGFLTWSGVYSELMFVDQHWPAFSVEDLEECLEDFEGRQRRYGK